MKIHSWTLIFLGVLTLAACSAPITQGRVIGVIPVTHTTNAVLVRSYGTASWFLLPEGFSASVGDSIQGRAKRVATGDYWPTLTEPVIGRYSWGPIWQ